MAISAWLQCLGTLPPSARVHFERLLREAGIEPTSGTAPPPGLCLVLFGQADDTVQAALRALPHEATAMAVHLGPRPLASPTQWALLDAGAADLVHWPEWPADATEISSRLQRWQTVRDLASSAPVRQAVAGHSSAWRALLRSVVEVAHFTPAAVLIQGETGTGKEHVARLVHELDSRPERGEFIVLDCTTVAPELAGSEFFGHERGAFTGAVGARDGAFALAHRGTLFLDEVGELSLPLQAQLLRVVQDRQYKRLGSNSWQHSDFRLVCATHRELLADIGTGRFRADLYHRISAWCCTTPPLRERREDILPLARFFLAQLAPDAAEVSMDSAVTEYLLTREYPGNVRELRQVVTRLWQRHGGCGPLTVGAVPPQERPQGALCHAAWPDRAFNQAVRHAVELGIGLKDIGQAAADLAAQAAIEREGGNLQRAAARLGVTDRALQIRQAQRRAAP